MNIINKQQQSGMSGMGLMFILAIVGFFGWIFFTLLPFYMTNGKVANAMENIKAQPEAVKMSVNDVQKSLLTRLSVESIGRITQTNFKDMTKYEKTNTGFKFTIQYEDRVKLVSNLYLLVVFDKTIEVK